MRSEFTIFSLKKYGNSANFIYCKPEKCFFCSPCRVVDWWSYKFQLASKCHSSKFPIPNLLIITSLMQGCLKKA